MSKLNFHGDTLVEVTIAIGAFSLVSLIILAIMTSGIKNLEGAIEATMARNEIDSQAEAIRFIHNAYLSEREYIRLDGNDQQKYLDIWERLKSFAVNPNNVPVQNLVPSTNNCDQFYNGANSESISANGKKPFIMNTRKLDPGNPNTSILSRSEATFSTTPTYPRIIYSNGSSNNSDTDLYEATTFDTVQYVQGIWITVYESVAKTTSYAIDGTRHSYPQYYDFHIYTCWTSPSNDAAATVGTIIRLYNPELIEVTDE